MSMKKVPMRASDVTPEQRDQLDTTRANIAALRARYTEAQRAADRAVVDRFNADQLPETPEEWMQLLGAQARMLEDRARQQTDEQIARLDRPLEFMRAVEAIQSSSAGCTKRTQRGVVAGGVKTRIKK